MNFKNDETFKKLAKENLELSEKLESLNQETDEALIDFFNNFKICSLCGEKYEGFGNNAEPLARACCCDSCNSLYVVPYRLGAISIKDVNKALNRNIVIGD